MWSASNCAGDDGLGERIQPHVDGGGVGTLPFVQIRQFGALAFVETRDVGAQLSQRAAAHDQHRAEDGACNGQQVGRGQCHPGRAFATARILVLSVAPDPLL